jgi:hypothetical protein
MRTTIKSKRLKRKKSSEWQHCTRSQEARKNIKRFGEGSKQVTQNAPYKETGPKLKLSPKKSTLVSFLNFKKLLHM